MFDSPQRFPTNNAELRKYGFVPPNRPRTLTLRTGFHTPFTGRCVTAVRTSAKARYSHLYCTEQLSAVQNNLKLPWKIVSRKSYSSKI